MKELRSSYKENNYGNVFRAIVLSSNPKLIVELGVLDGYSLFNLSNAVRCNVLERNLEGYIYAFDLWDNYRFKHGNMEEVRKMLIEEGLSSYVTLAKGDAFYVQNKFYDYSINLLHVDISNDGDKLIRILNLWENKLSDDGMIIFEGGSEKRDKVEWMIKYGKPSIRNELFNNRLVYKNWNFQIFDDFPSITLLWKKIKCQDGKKQIGINGH